MKDGNEALDGESGEIVVSTLDVEGTPLVRYRTGDIAKVYRQKCSCGRDTPRLGPIIGRKKQMIKYRGTTLYPKAIFEVMESFSEISCYKVLINKDELNNDEITILLEEKIESLEVFGKIKELCQARLRVIPKFQFIEANVLRSKVYVKHLRKPEKIKFS